MGLIDASIIVQTLQKKKKSQRISISSSDSTATRQQYPVLEKNTGKTRFKCCSLHSPSWGESHPLHHESLRGWSEEDNMGVHVGYNTTPKNIKGLQTWVFSGRALIMRTKPKLNSLPQCVGVLEGFLACLAKAAAAAAATGCHSAGWSEQPIDFQRESCRKTTHNQTNTYPYSLCSPVLRVSVSRLPCSNIDNKNSFHSTPFSCCVMLCLRVIEKTQLE